VEGGRMSSWTSWQPFVDCWVSNALALIYALICAALLVCHLCPGPRAWLRARLPKRWIPMSESDPLHAAWRDLVLSACGLAVIAWIVEAPVAALGMLAVTLMAALAAGVR